MVFFLISYKLMMIRRDIDERSRAKMRGLTCRRGERRCWSFRTIEKIVATALLTSAIIVRGIERKSREKCREYGKLVYSQESAPILRIDAGANNVSKCGIVEAPLIIGGVKAKPLEFPHMAVIGYGDPIAWKCGGTVVSDSYVLTAAHCLDAINMGPASKVRVGTTRLEHPNSGMQERNVAERIKHPQYVLPARHHDIALLKLDKPLVLGAEVRPACLEMETKVPGERAIACGFGRTTADSTVGSDDLMKVNLDYVPTKDCERMLAVDIGGRQWPQGLTDAMLCAGVLQGGKDTCQGDSGGPLQRVLEDPYCTYSIVGVTSFGKLCAFKNSPAVYTRVNSYLDWIESIVWP